MRHGPVVARRYFARSYRMPCRLHMTTQPVFNHFVVLRRVNNIVAITGQAIVNEKVTALESGADVGWPPASAHTSAIPNSSRSYYNRWPW